MKNISFIILMFVFSGVIAQENVLRNNVTSNYIQLRDELKSREVSESKLSNIEGSPYWEENFKNGKIESDGHTVQPVYLRYNARKEQIEIKPDLSDDEVFILPQNNRVIYNLNDYSYKYGLIETKEDKYIRGYLMRIFNSENIKFLSKVRAEIQPGKVAETSYDRSKPPHLNLIQDFYISVNGDSYEEVRLKEKDFRKIFRSENMKKYFKDHKIKDEKDVVAMLKYYEKNNS